MSESNSDPKKPAENHPEEIPEGCRPFESQLSAYLLASGEEDGDAFPKAEREALDAHLVTCGRCSDELELLRATVDAVESASPQVEALTSERRQSLLETAALSTGSAPGAASNRRVERSRFWGITAIAAAALIACTLAVRFYQENQGADERGTIVLESSMSQPAAIPAAADDAPEMATAVMDIQPPATELASAPKVESKRVDELALAPTGKAFGLHPSGVTYDAVPAPRSRARGAQGLLEAQVEMQVEPRLAELTKESAIAEVELKRSYRAGETPVEPLAKKPSVVTRAATPVSAELPDAAATRPGAGEPTPYFAGRAPRSAAAAPNEASPPKGIDVTNLSRPTPAPTAGSTATRGLGPEDKTYRSFRWSTAPDDNVVVSGGFGQADGAAVIDEKIARLKTTLGEERDRNVRRRIPANRGESEDSAAGAPAPTQIDPRVQIDHILSRLDRRPGEEPSAMFFRFWGDNPFTETAGDNLSTFGVDVDTASYTLMRSYLYKRQRIPPKEAVRTEEFINYFKNHYTPPAAGEGAFAIHTELAPSAFAHEPQYRLLKVGLKGREVERQERKSCNLVFVIDTSGSMRRENRLELVKDALRPLVNELDEGDTIGIVAFETTSRVVLEPCDVSARERVLDAISMLAPGGSTNVDAGLTMGYRMAATRFQEDAANRVILLSDGVANTGATDQQRILENVRDERQKGIYLTCVGVGMGNHNDALLEQLADRGDGQCVYVDRADEARRVFVENLTGTLETIARDVKIQVEFDRDKVVRYRLLGYENRAIADADFRNDRIDAGEVGAGHEVTALYEIKCRPEAAGKLATVRVRYKTVDHGEAVELEHAVEASNARGSFADATTYFQLSALVAEFAEILRDSYWARGSDLARVADMTQNLLGSGEGKLGNDKDVAELVALMKAATPLVNERRARLDELAVVVDALKENSYLRHQLEAAVARESEERRRLLEGLQRQNDELRRSLEQLLDRPR